jgi:hypothetical protein
MVQWKASKCSKHSSYTLKVETGTERPVPMTSVKSLATRVYRLKCVHAPTGVYLTQFGHWDDDQCWWCSGGGRMVAHTQDHHDHCRSQCRDQPETLWKAVTKATG